MPRVSPSENKFALEVDKAKNTYAKHELRPRQHGIDELTAITVVLINNENGLDKQYIEGDSLHDYILVSIKDAITAPVDEARSPLLCTTSSLSMDLVCILLGRGDFSNELWKAVIASTSEASFCPYSEENKAPADLPRLIESQTFTLLQRFNKELEANYSSLTSIEISQFARLLTCLSPSNYVIHWLEQYPQLTIKAQYQQIHQMYKEVVGLSLNEKQYDEKVEQRLNNILSMLKCLADKAWGKIANIYVDEGKERFRQEYERFFREVSSKEWEVLSTFIPQIQKRLQMQYGHLIIKGPLIEKTIPGILNTMEILIKPYIKNLPELYERVLSDEGAAPSSSSKKGKRKDSPRELAEKHPSPRAEYSPASSSSSEAQSDKIASPRRERKADSLLDILKDKLSSSKK